jgi:hypothetical protein
MRMDGDSDESPPSVLDVESQIASMGWESAKELDDAVTILTAPEHPFVTMSVKFRCRLCTKRAGARRCCSQSRYSTSRPEHYRPHRKGFTTVGRLHCG